MKLDLPWQKGISVNQIYEWKHGHRSLTDEAATFRDFVMLHVRMNTGTLAREMVRQGRHLGMWVDFWPPDEGKHDGDNLFKLLCDAIAAEVGFDDGKIWEHHIARHPSLGPPHIKIELSILAR